ncbi:PadR family transcriptional regulator [Streptomyces huiliensis]|uniref:PadR family transcriptional regulator n=1 Tax=Streptomyces huiliensis TaxID=2876027 RepID=UPI001CBAF4F9|nr:PadR family transcriptional regulator [Streptomyces huiliensis]MBZ4319574.1 PadR family transcriptional regulator [Streptomyces huiliensis]
MPVKRPANPLALAVLGLLLEQPLHPHAMAAVLRERQLDLTFKLTTGSLYDTVRALARDGWIEEAGTERAGGRPARTVYRHTPEGRGHFTAWLDELIREPTREFPKFLSALSYLGALGPARAAAALRERAAALEARAAADERAYQAARDEHRVPRLFVIEAEYARAMAEAELRWVRHTAEEIERGALSWPGEENGEGDNEGEAPGA